MKVYEGFLYIEVLGDARVPVISRWVVTEEEVVNHVKKSPMCRSKRLCEMMLRDALRSFRNGKLEYYYPSDVVDLLKVLEKYRGRRVRITIEPLDGE